MGALYEGLVGQYPPDLTKFQPILAKEVPTKENSGISADGKTYTFKLRENVKFHGGNPMTADDVVFSMKRLHYLQNNPSFLTDPFSTKDAVNVQAVDPLTVKFTLTDPNVAFLSYLATTNTVVLDAKTVKANGGTDAADAKDTDKAKSWLDQNSAGTGPYKLTSYKNKEEVVVEKNTGYWRAPAAFDQVVLKYIKDSGTALQQLQAGAIDIAQSLDADAVAGLKGNSNFTVVEGNSLNHAYLALNTDPAVGDVVADKRVRQAIGYSVDYDGLIKGLKKGAAVQPATIVPLGLLSADKAQQYAYKTDVAKAQGLIKDAGATGKSIKLTYGAGGTAEGIANDTLAPKLKADIERNGLKVELVPMEPQQRLADYRAAKLQFTFSTWSPDYVDVHTYAEPFGMTGGAAAKRVKYSNPKVDDLLKQGLVETDTQKRSDIYQQIQQILVDDAPFLVLYQTVFQVATKKNITDYQIHPIFLVNLYALKRS
jgi:peptide/nickel transport system substrate-binding protein